jgi:hypothetical protein
MIPDAPPPMQPSTAPCPDLGPRCPWCGGPWPFDPRASGLLDMVLLAQAVLSDMQAALEEGVTP